jgi:Transglutaminase-like superfamily
MKSVFQPLMLSMMWIGIISCVACTPHPRVAEDHPTYPVGMIPLSHAEAANLADRVAATLSNHYQGDAIATWRGTLSEGSLERDAADWILAWLPVADLVGLELSTLQEHVYFAAQVYRQAPWRNQLPRDLWLRFVVPHRVSQEPSQAWRRQFYHDIWPRVREAGSMELAALEVNRWCREQATFKSTSGRDQGPLTTIKRGIGRCEEEMILTICALRAVGLPARSCATPYWTFTDNNHAWVETWADGSWYYLGGCEPGRCLNDAWFTGAARRAGFVRSVAYGEFVPTNEPLYRSENGSTLINSTRVYTTPFELTPHIAGIELGACDIYINVMNFGSLRPIAKIASGGTIEIGPGEYALTAAMDEQAPMLLKVVRGQPGGAVEITLSETDRYDLAASPGFWLRYPESEQAPKRDLDLVAERDQSLHQLRLRARDADREKLRSLNEAEEETLAALDSISASVISATLEKPIQSVSDVFTLLAYYPDVPARPALIDFLSRTDDKDLLELSVFDIASHLDYALAVRHRTEKAGLFFADSLFYEYILACRIDYESGGPWREGLPLIPLVEGNPRQSVTKLLARYHDQIKPVERQFFGNLMNPSDTWLAGHGTPRDRAIALIGLLRRNGFPARYHHGATQVWLEDWIRLDPETADFYSAPEQSGQVADSDAPGRLELTITRGGMPYPEAQSYANFNISRPKEGYYENPWWDPQLGEQEWPTGDFVLSSAMRIPGGSIYCRLREFQVQPGALTSVSLPVDIDASEWNPGEGLISHIDDSLLRKLSSAQEETLPEHGLFFFFIPGEPASRMLTAFSRVGPRLVAGNIELVPVLIGDDDAGAWEDQLAEAGFAGQLRRIANLSDMTDFEPITLLKVAGDQGNKTLFQLQGFDAGIDGQVHLALDILENN